MELMTKYNLGSVVYRLLRDVRRLKVDCESCEGVGHFVVPTKLGRISCSDCMGRGKMYVDPPVDTFTIKGPLTIGQIRAVQTREEYKVEYMCEETGVGSGIVYSQEDLFPTYEEAYRTGINRGWIDSHSDA